MRSLKDKPAVYVHQGDELSLSGAQMIELMRSVLGRGASFRFKARGWSMAPFIRDGDILTLMPLNGSLSIGDVVAFVHPANHNLVVHRLVKAKNRNYELKGDNISHIDGIIPCEGLIGKVTKVERTNKALRLGLGMERGIIARLSRVNIIIRLNQVLSAAYGLKKRVICL